MAPVAQRCSTRHLPWSASQVSRTRATFALLAFLATLAGLDFVCQPSLASPLPPIARQARLSGASSAPSLAAAPLNPAFTAYLRSRSMSALRSGPAQHGLGLMPSPIDFSYLRSAQMGLKSSSLSQLLSTCAQRASSRRSRTRTHTVPAGPSRPWAPRVLPFALRSGELLGRQPGPGFGLRLVVRSQHRRLGLRQRLHARRELAIWPRPISPAGPARWPPVKTPTATATHRRA